MVDSSASFLLQKKWHILLCVASFSLWTTGAYGMQPGSTIGYYTSQYVQIKPGDSKQIAKVFEVFKRVAAVADKSKKRLPKLVVVASKAEPWAIALPDGHIILSQQAINICHTQVKETEACLAFILGHELAHLANDDFWHQEVYNFLATHKDTQHIAHFLKNSTSSIGAELAADDKGFIYATMAGFRVANLIDNQITDTDFFELWMQLTNSQLVLRGKTKNRSAPLKLRFKELQKKLGLYEFGVRLSHFGYCDDSVYFLKEFQKIFPGREVFNNLGYCYLQMAIRKMSGSRAWFYWLPLVLDIDTQARAPSRGGLSNKSLKAAAEKEPSELLDRAVVYFKQAVEADPYYLPAKINLAVAFLYLGRPLEARVSIQKLRELKPDNSNYAELEALALYEESDSELDRWPNAVNRLKKLIREDAANTSPSLVYNLARLLEIRSKSEESTDLWLLLTKKHDDLPMPIRLEACSKQKAIAILECTQIKKHSNSHSSPWKWPLKITSLQKITAEQTKKLSNWDKLEFDWYEDDLYGQIYTNPINQSQVLVLGQFIQMQVIKNSTMGSFMDIKSSCSQKLSKQKLAQGTIFSCDQWAIVVRGDEIQEAWLIAK